MTNLVNQKTDQLAHDMGWTPQRARGYVDGESCQQGGRELAESYKYGMDEYSKGYRTGFYTQACSVSITTIRDTLTAGFGNSNALRSD